MSLRHWGIKKIEILKGWGKLHQLFRAYWTQTTNIQSIGKCYRDLINLTWHTWINPNFLTNEPFRQNSAKKNKLCRKGPRGYDFTYTPHQIFAITKSLWTAPSSRIAVGFVVKERIISPWLSKIASSKEVKPLIRTLPTTSNIQISSPNIMTTKRQIAIRVNIVSDLRLIWGWLLLLNKQQTT